MQSGTHSVAALLSQSGPLVIAHRGACRQAPENTLPAFEIAANWGVDLIELDCQASADGVPIVIHDDDLRRTTSAPAEWGTQRLKVVERTADELAALDAGQWFGPRFQGTRLSPLADVLATISPRTPLLIECKSGSPAELCRLLTDNPRWVDRVAVQSFDWRFLAECRSRLPNLVLGALGEEKLTPERLDQMAGLDIAAVGWRNEDVDAAAIELAHQRQFQVWVWTVDDPARQRQLLDAGVDGLITNEADRLLVALGRR